MSSKRASPSHRPTSSSGAQSVRFTDQQRKRLLKLRWLWRPDRHTRLTKQRLLPQQVDRLEEILATCRVLLNKPATMTEVRDKLSDIARAIRRAHRLVSGSSAASREALDRLELAHMEDVEVRIEVRNQAAQSAVMELRDPTSEPDFVTSLRSLSRFAESALQALPRIQRRANTASPSPIERIERALWQGFTDHHLPGALPPYPLHISVSKQPFPAIAATVYQAIGIKGKSPERAIRAYIKLRRRSHSARAHHSA